MRMENSRYKFRAWDKDFKKMYYKGFWISCDYPNSDGDICFDRKIFRTGKYSPLGLTLMQFTGLLDKNGNPIYEGDIVKVGTIFEGEWENAPTIHKIVWGDDYPAFDLWPPIECECNALQLYAHVCENDEAIEVIGNVFEHGHLLK